MPGPDLRLLAGGCVCVRLMACSMTRPPCPPFRLLSPARLLLSRLRPHHNPKLYLVFLVAVHAVVEAGIAFTLLYTTWVSPPWVLTLCNCNCGGSKVPAPTAGRRDDVSTPGGSGVVFGSPSLP